MSVVSYAVEQGVAIVTADSPPVNALGHAVREGLVAALRQAEADVGASAIVLICSGRTFFAGADITEFGAPPRSPSLHEVLAQLEQSSKLVVAAIHGTALGGGLETALACHYRVAVPSAKVGVPEVALGILPGAGGTQRLPRLMGPEAALDFILGGKPIGAAAAERAGVIDMVVEGDLRSGAIAFAARQVAEGAPLRKVRDRNELIAGYRGQPERFDAVIAKHGRALQGFKAPAAIIEAVAAAVDLPFDEGLAVERRLLGELVSSQESKAQRHAFFAERATSKVPDVPADTQLLLVKSVGVLGAGTMGGGIAMNFLNIDIPVTIVELKQEALDRGIGVIRANYERSEKRGSIKPGEAERRMALLTGALDLGALADVDLVIEAVFESMEVKQDVFARLDAVVKPGAILATNTSFLDIDAIAGATSRPQDVIGLHFFSPANVMRLLEVVRGRATSPALIATAMQLAKQIGKVPVLARVCHGFIANRAMAKRGAQADRLVLEGASPVAVDRVLTDYGFTVGHFAMRDIVGLDVIGRGATERTVAKDLVAIGRLGQKQGGGYYDYDENRKATPSPVAAAAIAGLAADLGIAQRPFDDREILERLLYPVVNECAKILEEGIAIRSSDADIAMIMGYNWPVFTGGPTFWADHVGLPTIVASLKAFEAEHGEAFRPSALLERLAAEGKRFQDA